MELRASSRYMNMQHKRLFAGLLIAFTIVAGLYCGMPTLGMASLDGHHYSKASTNSPVMTSQTPPVLDWNKINYASIMPILQGGTPSPAGSITTPGVVVPTDNMSGAIFYSKLTTNASTIHPVLGMRYKEQFFVSCTDASAVSNFTIRYRPSLANDTYDTVRFFALNGSNVVNYTRTFTQKNNTILIAPDLNNPGLHLFRFEARDFYFNISEAVHIFENKNITDPTANKRFIIELNYTFPIYISNWQITTTSPYFGIDGLQTKHTISYSEQFTIKSDNYVDLTFYFIPADLVSTFGYTFYSRDLNIQNSVLTQISTPLFNQTVRGYYIAPGGSHVVANTNGTLINISFKANATVGFTEIKTNRWTFDRLVTGLDSRVRQYQLTVLQGPATYLVENIRFNITDMMFNKIYSNSNASYPDGWFTCVNNTYQQVDPQLEQTVNVPNGTRCILHRIQKNQGPVTVSFQYNSSYNATFRILDEVRNPLPGAEVVLNYSGVRFGTLMAWNTTLAYPSIITGSSGLISYTYLPQGNYTVMVYYQGKIVQSKNFTLDKTNSPLSLEIITTVPYAPSILIGWFVIFGVLAVLGIVLLKRKR